MPFLTICVARALALAALPGVSTGYFLSRGSANSEDGNALRCAAVIFATMGLQIPGQLP